MLFVVNERLSFIRYFILNILELSIIISSLLDICRIQVKIKN